MAKKIINSALVGSIVGCFCLYLGANAAFAQTISKLSPDGNRVLSWLPRDTESLIVSTAPYEIQEYRRDDAKSGEEHVLGSSELQKQFQETTMGLLGFKEGMLTRHLKGENVSFAALGSRNFRPPQALGEQLFDGCLIAVFSTQIDAQRDDFLKEAAKTAQRVDDIGEHKVAVFQEQLENDVWTIWVTFPERNVVLVATSGNYLREVIDRISTPDSERAFPDTLVEWKYVDPSSEFWGIRHFAKKLASLDQTSPFAGKHSFSSPDEQAIGMTVQSNPTKQSEAIVTYLSDNKESAMQIEKNRFPISSEPELTGKLHIQYRELAPGVVQSQFNLRHSEAVGWFMFVLMANLGHAIFI